MKRSIIFALVIFFAGICFADIDAKLLEKMNDARGEQLPIIVTFQETFDVAATINTFGIRGDQDAIARQTIQILQNKAERTHHWLKVLCQQRNAQVSDFNSFWIANMVSLKASSEMIREINSQPGVTKIFLDAQHQFINYKTGTPTRDAWGLDKIGSKEVNKTHKGKGVLVAVIDTGVNYNHNDLRGRVVKGKDTINNDMDPLDDNGHGSHCAGTVAGTTFGVAPEADILAVKVLSGTGSGSWASVAQGVEYVASYNENGRRVDVASLSLGGSPPIQDVLKTAFQNAIDLGVVMVIAAGNEGSWWPGTVQTPGDLQEVITVGATDRDDSIASFSSVGPVTWYGGSYVKPDVSAPGVNITSCWKGGANATNTISGTSMATPHVAGLVALVMDAKGKMKNDRVKQILEGSAKDLGDNGKDNTFGSGRIQAKEAVKSIRTRGIEKEFEFPIKPGGIIDVQFSQENPLWALKVNVDLTVLNPAGDFAGSFSIKNSKGNVSKDIKLSAGKTLSLKNLTIHDGMNHVAIKFKYSGNEKVSKGIIKANITLLGDDNPTRRVSFNNNRLEIETEIDFPIGPDGSINLEKTATNPLWTIRAKLEFNILSPNGLWNGFAKVSKAGKSDQTLEIKNLKSGSKFKVAKTITVYEGENTAMLKAQYTGNEKVAEGKIWVKVQTDDLK